MKRFTTLATKGSHVVKEETIEAIKQELKKVPRPTSTTDAPQPYTWEQCLADDSLNGIAMDQELDSFLQHLSSQPPSPVQDLQDIDMLIDMLPADAAPVHAPATATPAHALAHVSSTADNNYLLFDSSQTQMELEWPDKQVLASSYAADWSDDVDPSIISRPMQMPASSYPSPVDICIPSPF